MNAVLRLSCLIALLLLLTVKAQATPTQFGVSGLLSQPSADTLDSGNISVGLWVNSAEQSDSESTTLVPISLGMGLGTFIEAYGSFPNLLFNDDETLSGRGFADLGLKIRVLGRRSSPYKLALDFQAQRQISDQENLDGQTDILARSIFTLKKGRFGLHLNAGYSFNDDQSEADDQVVGGVGVEYFPAARLRIIAELDAATKRFSGLDNELEAMLGLQYFFSPHLTFHAGFGRGLTDTAADWRFLAGLSTSQGIGTFTKPIPRLILPVEPEKDPEVKKRNLKFRTITPLLPMSRLGQPAPRIASEMPVNPGEEKVIVQPEDQIQLPEKDYRKIQSSPIASPSPAKPKEKPEQFKATQPINTVVYRKFRFDDVNFGFDQSSLSEAGKASLVQIAESLRKEKKWFLIRINGHTDSIGSAAYNEKLSYQRAISVGHRLVAYEGFDPARIFVKGLGETQPLASNKTPEERRKNRRAEILVLLPEKQD